MRERPYIPAEVATDPDTVIFYLPLWCWNAWDRQRKNASRTASEFAKISLNREFDHLRGKALKAAYVAPDEYALTRYGKPARWAALKVPTWVRLEFELQTKAGGKTISERVAHAFKLQALGVRLMNQLKIWE